MTKYYCKQCNPKHTWVLDESCVRKTNADGSPGNVCKGCSQEYSPLESTERKEQAFPAVKFKGAGWASKDIKLQNQYAKALENRKYKNEG